MSTTVDVIADAIKYAGTPFIAGHPGGESVELMEAARQRDMRFLLMKQESAGAILAATWGEITGAPGVCLSTRGPGATNMVNGVSYAALDRAALIAITDQYPSETLATGQRQVIDQRRLYAGITKWSTTLVAASAAQQLARGIATATAAAPGPVHFDLPASETLRETSPLTSDPVARPCRQTHSVICDEALVDRINKAKRPVLLAGLGVLWDHASDALTGLAEALGAPVLTTSKCKGAIPEDHPLRAGCIIGGLIERTLIEQSDLIITVGLDTVELQPKPWPYQIPVISLHCVKTTDVLVPSTYETVGQLDLILDFLADRCASGNAWGESGARQYRKAVSQALDIGGSGLTPQRVVDIARHCLPRNTIASCDAGASRLLVVQKWCAFGPREFLTSNGLGTMGYAIPGAMAARLAWPDRPIVAFSGDGGFMMAMAEIQTAVRESLPIIVVVFDDREIALIRVKQEIKGIPRHGVSIGGMQWEALAAGFGINCHVADNEAQLVDAFTDALAHPTETTLVVASIDGSGYVDQFKALREL